MPRRFADLVRRISRGYGIPTSQADALLARAVFTINLDSVADIEASDVFASRPSIGVATQTATGAFVPHCQLFVPAGAGVIASVPAIFLSSATAQAVNIRTHNVALGTLQTSLAFRDRRLEGLPATEVRAADLAATGATVGRAAIPADESIVFPLDFVLEPGNGIVFTGTVAASDLEATFLWTEEDAA